MAESDLTLILGTRVAQTLRRMGHTVTLTRTSNHDVGLAERTQLANRLRADVFVSIHLNATPTNPFGWRSPTAQGIETYILNNATDASARRVAQLENSIITHQAHAARNAPDVALILKDLRLDENLAESKRLACLIQSDLVRASGGRGADRGVKQALFHVLLGADMPSVLVEAGFLGNANDRNRLLNPKSQTQMASAIARAIDRFGVTRGTKIANQQLASCPVR